MTIAIEQDFESLVHASETSAASQQYLDSPLLVDSNIPNHSARVNVPAEGNNVDTALWTIDIIPA